jgi:hypothetical protein
MGKRTLGGAEKKLLKGTLANHARRKLLITHIMKTQKEVFHAAEPIILNNVS